uniref:Putative NB-ARC, P-loop containing nucleoside triphosphate hydrolase n=1 Tax=Helianthus annuus TaxID=4232 RepID=A0A251T148_HELAN
MFKCGGLPLAIKAIGRLLRTKTDREDWDDLLNSEIWDLENANEIVPTLRLSYHDMMMRTIETHRCYWNRNCSRAN